MKRTNLCVFLASLIASTSVIAVTHTVNVSDFQFSPQMLTIDPGDTVEFVWVSGSHPVASDDGSWTTFSISGGNPSNELVLTTPGTYFYHCTAHGSPQNGMWGQITVSSPPPILATVQVADSTFTPQFLTIDPGDTVEFVWVSGDHLVESDDGSWPTFPITAADPTQHLILTTPGTYFYHCQIHGGPQIGMWGQITVTGTPASVSEATPPETYAIMHSPGQDVIRVWCSESDASAQVISVLGQVCSLSPTSQDAWTTVDVSGLPRGNYIVLLASDRGIVGSRLIHR